MNGRSQSTHPHLPPDNPATDSTWVEISVQQIWAQQLASYQSGSLTTAETFFREHPELAADEGAAVEIIFNELMLCHSQQAGRIDPDPWLRRFPQYREALRQQVQICSALESVALERPPSVLLGPPGATPEPVSNSDEEAEFAERHSPSREIRYSIVRELGRGGMAVVFEGYDRRLQQPVAIKQLHPHLAGSKRIRWRLRREARAVAKLHHPGIVPLREFHESDSGWWLVAPLVRGSDLKRKLEKQTATIDQAIRWTAQVAEAAHYAHENGVIHRDIKPSNILIDEDGRARLTDFGLAYDAQDDSDITRTGEMVGTPAFMAPEQTSEDVDRVDPRADVYSIGATLYFLLTGRRPYQGGISQVIRQLAESDPPRVRDFDRSLPAELDTIVHKCMRPRKEDRYGTAREVSDDLRRFQAGEPIQARSAGWLERWVKFARRKPYFAAGACLLLVLAVFTTGMAIQLSNVIGERNRAVIAEQKNQQLLASATLDAGRLAMQRGRLATAARHFESGRQLQPQPEPTTLLDLTACHLALGNVDRAAEVLDELRTLADAGTSQLRAAVGYWEAEWAARAGLSADEIHAGIDSRMMRHLKPANRSFLLGLKAEHSIEAMDHFRAAVESDPYHHSARKMSLILALSLARFEAVVDEAGLARQLFPEDRDFPMFEALAKSALGELDAAQQLVDRTWADETDQKPWHAFCQFLQYVTHEVHPKKGVYRTDLNTIAELMATFEHDFQPLLIARGWRFPPAIGDSFLQLEAWLDQADEPDDHRRLATDLANQHPEATLLLIAAESTIGNPETPAQLQEAGRLFRRAVDAPAFIQGSGQTGWLGVYTTAMALAVKHKHEVEQSRKLYVEACEHLDPGKIEHPGYLATIVKTLARADRWDLALPFADRWIEVAPPRASLLDAYWHRAVGLKVMGQWVGLVETCKLVIDTKLTPEELEAAPEWISLRAHGIQKLQQLVDDVSTADPETTAERQVPSHK